MESTRVVQHTLTLDDSEMADLRLLVRVAITLDDGENGHTQGSSSRAPQEGEPAMRPGLREFASRFLRTTGGHT